LMQSYVYPRLLHGRDVQDGTVVALLNVKALSCAMSGVASLA
jgi:hypothetical protein